MSFFRKLRFNLLYWKNPPWDTNQSPPELFEFIKDHQTGKALDLGCGTGTNAITLAKAGWEVIGVDFIRKPIISARKKAQAADVQVRFFQADVTRLDFLHDKFNLILDIGCYHSLDHLSKERYLSNLKNLLDPTGTFLLYAFTAPEPAGIGVSECDISSINKIVTLVHKKNGTDRNRPSAWYTFHGPPEPIKSQIDEHP